MLCGASSIGPKAATAAISLDDVIVRPEAWERVRAKKAQEIAQLASCNGCRAAREIPRT